MNETFLEQIIRLAAAYEVVDSLRFVIVVASGPHAGYWAGPGEKEGKLTVSVGCNDVFWWATADDEPIETAEDLKLLESCLKRSESYGPLMYACRRRKMRPQNCVLVKLPEDIQTELKKCGPPRTNEECG